MAMRWLTGPGLVAIVTMGARAEAHIDLQEPAPRYVDGYAGQKTGPCGAGTPSNVVTEWTAGEEVTLVWEETINHNGHYRIALDPTGTDNFTDPDPPGNTLVAGNVLAFVDDTSSVAGNEVSYTLTVPDYSCDPCTLQVIQYMQNSAEPFYYFCADVKIAGSGSGSTTTTGAGVGGGGSGGQDGTGGADPTSTSSGSAQYPEFARQDTGCAVRPAGSSAPWLGSALLAAAFGLARRRRAGGR